ncbi:MAG: hypothetical protein ACRYG4_04060 [Janthinobacterium lividum]
MTSSLAGWLLAAAIAALWILGICVFTGSPDDRAIKLDPMGELRR